MTEVEVLEALETEQHRLRELANEIVVHAALLEQLRADLQDAIKNVTSYASS